MDKFILLLGGYNLIHQDLYLKGYVVYNIVHNRGEAVLYLIDLKIIGNEDTEI